MSNSEITIFVVEDDANIRFGLEEVLRAEGYGLLSCERGDEAIPEIAKALPDLVLLDVMLPGKSGYEIAQELRKDGCRIPILMLTAKGQEMDKVVGLNSGADDYVTKPFSIVELLARVKALLRRSNGWDVAGAERETEPESTFSVGNATVDAANYEISLDGETASLTPRELELLRYLHGHRGEVLSRDRILEAVWGVKYFGTTRTLDQCVAQVRKKIGDAGRDPQCLVTVHGVGYKLV
ncbi:MAG: response regulator transcription factor [Verrucomicrobiales bacterium]|nr:response regulator transcription factor [Verrucomicrobiales bacterium]